MTSNFRKVSLVKGPHRYDNIRKSLELIKPDLDKIRGKKRILIKPNLVNFIFKNSMAYIKATKVIHKNIVNLAKLTWPDLVILDAFYCMDGNGPVDGFPVKLEAAVSSCDPLKADGVGARLMGLQPKDIGYLYYLQEEGLGDYSLNGLVGCEIEQVRQDFKMHPTYNIQKNWRDA